MVPDYASTFAVASAALTILLLAAALAIIKASRARREMDAQARDLTRRAEQLRLLNGLSSLLAQETRRRGVADATAEFLVHEMGAERAVLWRPDGDGEPRDPWITYPTEESGEGAPLPEAQRIILAQTARRGDGPLIVALDDEDQRPHQLEGASAPAGRFVLYAPLSGVPSEGVLEVYGTGERWTGERWEILWPLVAQVADALRRGRSYEEAREEADLDFVTGVFNHRFMQVYLQRLVQAEGRRQRNFAILLMDINNFKTFNDTYGHQVGDRVLQVVSGQLKLMTDKVGVVGRMGGDEFIVVLPGVSPEEATSFGQAFQDWLANHAFRTPAGGSAPIEVSAGVAMFPEDGDRRQELLAIADARLYQSKRSGHGGEPTRAVLPGHGLGVFGLLDSLVSTIDSRDHYTRSHSETTAEYALMLAQALELSPSAQRTLRLAALLHDVGKICVPDDLLRKAGPLTPDEYAVIKHHAAMAERLIVDLPNADEIRSIVRHHHERWDGGGYPDGLAGESIPFPARIIALADAFSAITLDRPHRDGLSQTEAYEELKRVAGSQLDPELVAAFGQVVAALEREAAAAYPIVA